MVGPGAAHRQTHFLIFLSLLMSVARLQPASGLWGFQTEVELGAWCFVIDSYFVVGKRRNRADRMTTETRTDEVDIRDCRPMTTE